MNLMRRYPVAVRVAFLSWLLVTSFGLAANAQDGQGQNSSLFAGFGSDSDIPYEIDANELTLFEDRQIAILTGDVNVRQGENLLKTPYLKVFYTNSKSASSAQQSQGVRRIEAREGVYVESGLQVATGDEADYDAQTEIMIMTGNVVLIDGCNVINGDKLHVNLRTGESKVTAPVNTRVRLKFNNNAGSSKDECGTH